MLANVLQESDGAAKLHAIDGLGSLAGVLEGHTEERTAGFGGLCLVLGGSSVANLEFRKNVSSVFGFHVQSLSSQTHPIAPTTTATKFKISPSVSIWQRFPCDRVPEAGFKLTIV